MNSVFRTHCWRDWQWDTRKNLLPDMDLWVVLSGEGNLRTPRGDVPLRAGDSFALRRGEGYWGTHNPDKPLHVVAAHFDVFPPEPSGRPRLHKCAADVSDEQLPVFQCRLPSLPFAIGLLDRMVACWNADDRDGAAVWFAAVLEERERQAAQEKLDEPAGYLAVQIDALCREIRERPQEPHRVEEMARRLHRSRHHFSRVFRDRKGVSPNEYVVRARIEAAKGMLLASSDSIGQIAEQLGYRDVYFFSRQFRHVAGVSPTSFRRGEDADATR